MKWGNWTGTFALAAAAGLLVAAGAIAIGERRRRPEGTPGTAE